MQWEATLTKCDSLSKNMYSCDRVTTDIKPANFNNILKKAFLSLLPDMRIDFSVASTWRGTNFR